MSQDKKRLDDLGRAFAGSQLQTQIYVNRRAEELNAAIVAALPDLARSDRKLRWVSPVESGAYKEYRDELFLSALGHEALFDPLQNFWPKGGPVWDGLAIAEPGGVVLVEGKSYPAEMLSAGCQASAEASKELIHRSLERAKAWFGAPAGASWTGEFYQYANRLAHVYFFREVAGVDAWFVNLCFTDDVTHSDEQRAVDASTWRRELATAKQRLGVRAEDENIRRYTADVLLPARAREELL